MLNFLMTILGVIFIYGAFKGVSIWQTGASAADLTSTEMLLMLIGLFVVGVVLLYFGFIRNVRKRRAQAMSAAQNGSNSGKSQRRVAYWTQRTHIFRSDEYECSACGAKTDRPYKRCPNCRAIMKSARYDPSWVDEIEFMDAIDD
ncbi:MAG: hypothetical protein IJM61_06365 [Firmicutes bacterium]|nr:hypothetical protein [Bacillota bacterium]